MFKWIKDKIFGNEEKENQEIEAAEAERLREEAEAAEAERLREEAEAAEAERLREEAEAAEAERLREEAEAAEAERLREEAEAAEAERLREEEEAAEAERLREEAEAAEAERLREEAEAAEAERLREEAEAAEAERLREEAEAAEAERLREEAEAAEAERLREEAEAAEAERLREEAEAAEAESLREEAKAAEESKNEDLGFFAKLKKGLTKTRDNFTNQISNILKSYQKVDEELFEEIEEVLITADVGIETTMNLIDGLTDRVKEEKVTDPQEVMGLLKEEISKLAGENNLETSLNIEPAPAVILVVGVNGVGKTTTIGKMAHKLKKEGKSVLVAAGDTFRAAAIEQLEEWGKRADVDIVSHSEGADPAAVIYDAVQAAKARKTDVLICDTAGRLHNKANLMNELNKIFRVLEREYAGASKEVLLVLDATTGQNAMSQAKEFNQVTDITGIALTKLDGTAKGGVVIALQAELNIPVKLVGVGEGIEDLQPFNMKDFIDAIFDEEK